MTFDVPYNLHDDFNFHQGQHLTLKKTINGEDVRRSYSLCTSPEEKRWQVAIKQVPGGVFSTYANKELEKGEILEVMQPTGNFYVDIDSKSPNNYIAFAAGSGITPILSIIKTHLEAEPESTFKLFFLNTISTIKMTQWTFFFTM